MAKKRDRTELIDLRVNFAELQEITLTLKRRRDDAREYVEAGQPWRGGRPRLKRLTKLVEMFEEFEKIVTVQREAQEKYEAERAERLAAKAQAQS